MSNQRTIDVEIPADISLSKLSSPAQSLVRLAIACGWTARSLNGGALLLTSPEVGGSHQNITVPGGRTNLRESVTRSWTQKVLRYGDQLKVATVAAVMDGRREGREDFTTTVGSPMSRALSDPEFVPGVARSVTEVAAPKPGPPVAPKPEPVRHVLTTHAWMARRATSDQRGRYYPSQTVVERKWSDGTTDYACAFPGCEYTNDKARSVANHYGGSADHPVHGSSRNAEEFYGTPYEPSHRENNAATRLAAEIARALENLDGSWASYESVGELAEAVATKVVAMRQAARGDDSEPQGPLTPEQLLERIRRIVDDGSYLRQIEQTRSMEEQIALLTEQAEATRVEAEQCRAEADAQRARADALRAELVPLADLIKSLGTSSE